MHGVVAGIYGEGKWLLIRRGPRVSYPGKVCFPGGTVEEGETLAAALKRELVEELNLIVIPRRLCWHHVFPDKPLVLWGFFCELEGKQTPRMHPREISQILWLDRIQVARRKDGMPTNTGFLAALETPRAIASPPDWLPLGLELPASA